MSTNKHAAITPLSLKCNSQSGFQTDSCCALQNLMLQSMSPPKPRGNTGVSLVWHQPFSKVLLPTTCQVDDQMVRLLQVQVAQNAQLSGLLTHATGADGRYRGLTQLEMQTVLVVGPGPSSVIDGVTGGLPLF
jgi:hypothetical protein